MTVAIGVMASTAVYASPETRYDHSGRLDR